MLTEGELLLPDPKLLDSGEPELDITKGLSLRMMQAIIHYQWEEPCCFVYGVTNHFTWDCLHREAFHIWHLNSKWVGPQPKEPTPKSPPMVVGSHIAKTHSTNQ